MLIEQFDPKAETRGGFMLAMYTDLPQEKLNHLGPIFERHGMDPYSPQHWYSTKMVMEMYDDVSTTLGIHYVEELGNLLADSIVLLPHLVTMEQILDSVDMAYHQSHRGHNIGYYSLLHYDGGNHYAIMECRNPYPENFDKGLLAGMLRRFAPDTGQPQRVEVAKDKPSRNTGATSTTYELYW